MYRLDNILEDWAEIYKPLSHDRRGDICDRTFFRIESINNNNEFVQNFNKVSSPCMAYSTLVDGSLRRSNSKFISYRHVIYFLVQQKAPRTRSRTIVNDSIEATEARYDADDLVQDLLAFLFELKAAARQVTNGTVSQSTSDIVAEFIGNLTTDELQGIAGLQLEEAEWGTLPMKYNGWWICGLEIEQTVPRNLCVVREKYHTDND